MQKRQRTAAIFALAVLTVLLSGVFAVNEIQAANQAGQEYAWSHPLLSVPSTNESGSAAIVNYVTLTVILGTHDLFPNQTLLNEGWVANCTTLCIGGIK